MCEFHQLYLGPEGYIVVCKHCGYFQLCYGRLVLDLSKHDFGVLRMLIKKKLNAEYDYPDEELKQIIIPTPHLACIYCFPWQN
jgi:hypothetical protein